MIKRTGFLLSFFVANLVATSAYSVTVSKSYVDSSDKTLQKNILTVLGMLNEKDANKKYITLNTEAKLAIPAINELKAALDSKANADDVLTADSLTELNEAVAALQTGKATVADLEALQGTVDALGDTYATDDEVSAAIANVQSAIDNIDLSAYAKTADLASVATSGSYADLTNKPDIPSIEGLATDQDLTDLRSALETEIANRQIAGDYLVASDLTELSDAVAALQTGKADASTITTIQESISKLGDTYATKTDMTTADAELLAKINAISIPSLEGYVKLSDLASVATSGSYNDLTNKPEIPSIEGLATEQALTNLQATLQAAIDDKQAKGEYLVASDLTELSDAVAELQSGKADASTITTIQESISKLGDTYATKTDMTTADAELLAKINAISIPSLEGYVKLSDLAAVATSGSYNDLEDKPEIPSIDGLATEQALTNLQATLQAAIDDKQAKGEYLVAADLQTLNNAVTALQSGKADASTVTTIQETISKLGDTYATDAELTAAIDAVELLIPTIPTKVSEFENDAGYITDAALTDYAKSADVEMVANKVSDATAEQIEAMSSADKATKYPSIAVSQTIANAAVTKVNEVAGDLSTLQTQVSTNTADIAELDETVEDVRVVAYAAIPAPTEACKSASGACALSSDTEGNLTWVVIAGSLNNN